MCGRVCCRARAAPQGPAGARAPLRASLRTLTSAPLPLPYASRRSLARPRPSRGGRRRASLAAPPIARTNSPVLWRAWHCPCGSRGAGAERGLRKGPRVDPPPNPLRATCPPATLRAPPSPCLPHSAALQQFSARPARARYSDEPGASSDGIFCCEAGRRADRQAIARRARPRPCAALPARPFAPPPPFYSTVSSTPPPLPRAH